MKLPLQAKGQLRKMHGCPLIFQISNNLDVVPLPELAPSTRSWGCRGFIGPVPPPLWIRVPLGAIDLWRHDTTGGKMRQMQWDDKAYGLLKVKSFTAESLRTQRKSQKISANSASQRSKFSIAAFRTGHQGTLRKPYLFASWFSQRQLFYRRAAENAEKTTKNLGELCVSAVKILNCRVSHRASRDFEKAIPLCLVVFSTSTLLPQSR